jgi:hypothetical protein
MNRTTRRVSTTEAVAALSLTDVLAGGLQNGSLQPLTDRRRCDILWAAKYSGLAVACDGESSS